MCRATKFLSSFRGICFAAGTFFAMAGFSGGAWASLSCEGEISLEKTSGAITVTPGDMVTFDVVILNNLAPGSNGVLPPTPCGIVVTAASDFASPPGESTVVTECLISVPQGESAPCSFTREIVGGLDFHVDTVCMEFMTDTGQPFEEVCDTLSIPIVSANAAPDCTDAYADPPMLWPPKHNMVPIAILGVTDPDGDSVEVFIDGVDSDEPDDGLGDGDTVGDVDFSATMVQVRAERGGIGDGRIYTIMFSAEDGNGGTCSGEVVVCVPHDQRSGGCAPSG